MSWKRGGSRWRAPGASCWRTRRSGKRTLGNHTETLKGRGAIVTGSTSGIGLGIAQALAGQGASVLLNGFGEPEAIHKLVQGIGKRHQVKVVFSGADISKVDEVQEMVRYAEKALGSVDILV